eukprot:jgi/Mesvir1/8894/Mv02777-RA.1
MGLEQVSVRRKQSRQERESGFSLQEQRKRLPIFKYRSALLYLLEKHATVVVLGETGCGKTTQIPQYLYEAGWAAGGYVIACTQPRRLAAQTVAARVAEEMESRLGATVGYTIRFEDVSSQEATRIKYVTDGVLLREMLSDPLLSRYSVIMVDEAHERSASTDLLLGLLKKVQRCRPELRLIIASATLSAEAFADYYDQSNKSAKRRRRDADKESLDLKPAILSAEGRTFGVTVHYLEQPCSNYVQEAVSTVMEIHKKERPGDILVFLTGQQEVEEAVSAIEEEGQRLGGRRGDWWHCRYTLDCQHQRSLARNDSLPTNQAAVFNAAPVNRRKVIVATNIAETSITIEGVVYVVDCGFVKVPYYNPLSGIEGLYVVPASKANARQRAGRAGRIRPGKCFRLYTEEAHADMADDLSPEIQRLELSGTVLQLKALGVDNVMSFHWMAPPSPEAMMRALELLYALGALDAGGCLTHPLGTAMAEIPLDPRLARALLASGEMNCSEEMTTIAAMLCVQSIWVTARGQIKALDAAKAKFAVAEGDLITYLNVFAAFSRAKPNKVGAWCHKNFINYRTMLRAVEIKEQLKGYVKRAGHAVKSAGTDTKVIRRAITAGFFGNAAKLLPHGDGATYALVRGGQHVKMHPSSVLRTCSPPLVVFHELVQTDALYMREVVMIEQAWLLELAPHFFQVQRKQH